MTPPITTSTIYGNRYTVVWHESDLPKFISNEKVAGGYHYYALRENNMNGLLRKQHLGTALPPLPHTLMPIESHARLIARYESEGLHIYGKDSEGSEWSVYVAHGVLEYTSLDGKGYSGPSFMELRTAYCTFNNQRVDVAIEANDAGDSGDSAYNQANQLNERPS